MGEGQGEGLSGATASQSGAGMKTRPSTISRARRLRLQSTDAERALWHLLRDRRMQSHKFRRQHPVGNFYLDFYCPESKLAIEADGGQHFEDAATAYDEKRTEFLKEQGIRVLRFTNREILTERE